MPTPIITAPSAQQPKRYSELIAVPLIVQWVISSRWRTTCVACRSLRKSDAGGARASSVPQMINTMATS